MSFSGCIIASSYLPVTNTDKIAVIDKHMANIPNSLGEYNLVKTGVVAIGIACAMVVPVIRVSTLRVNSDFGFNFFINVLTLQFFQLIF